MVRRLLFAIFLVTALLLGQQAAVEHALAHATEQLGSKAPAPKHACDQCFLGAQLSGAMGAHVVGLGYVAAGIVLALTAADGVVLLPPYLAFRSRAPPSFP